MTERTPRRARWQQRIPRAVLLAGLALLALGLACRGAGLRVNTSASMAPGLYRVSAAAPAVGSLVLWCPPPSPVFALARQRGYVGAGFCPGGYGYMIKQLVAADADGVRFSADGVYVNGRRLPDSAALPADSAGRPLPRLAPRSRVLAPGEVLLMSPGRPSAFDARYFGLLPAGQIESVMVPLMTWPARSPAGRSERPGSAAISGRGRCAGWSAIA